MKQLRSSLMQNDMQLSSVCTISDSNCFTKCQKSFSTTNRRKMSLMIITVSLHRNSSLINQPKYSRFIFDLSISLILRLPQVSPIQMELVKWLPFIPSFRIIYFLLNGCVSWRCRLRSIRIARFYLNRKCSQNWIANEMKCWNDIVVLPSPSTTTSSHFNKNATQTSSTNLIGRAQITSCSFLCLSVSW